MKHLILYLVCLLPACSLLIETGTPQGEDDAELPPLQVRDALPAPTDDVGDTGTARDAESVLDVAFELDTTADHTDASARDAMSPYQDGAMDTAVSPECIEDADCEDGFTCENERCVAEPCQGLCSADQVCVAECCQQPEDLAEAGACERPITARVRFNRVNDRRVANAGVASLDVLCPMSLVSPIHFLLTPQRAGLFCVRTVRGTVTPEDPPLALD